MREKNHVGYNPDIKERHEDSSHVLVDHLLEKTNLQSVGKSIKEALYLLAEQGKEFVSFEEHSVQMIDYLYQEIGKDFLTEEEYQIARQGTVLSDIGKAGGPMMTELDKRLAVALYSFKNVPGGSSKTVMSLLHDHAPDLVRQLEVADEGTLLQELSHLTQSAELSLSGEDDWKNVTLQSFWSGGHTMWTYQHLMQPDTQVDPSVFPSAVLHHVFEGQNPGNILLNNGEFNQPYGERTVFGKPELLVLLVDKYDAMVERGKIGSKEGAIERISHDQAIASLSNLIGIARTESSLFAHVVLDSMARNMICNQAEQILQMMEEHLQSFHIQ